MASFELMGRRVLRAQLRGETIRAISGSMVAYEGQVQFKASGFGGGEGLMAGIRRQATGEQLTLMECSGQGTVYFAIMAQDVSVVDLNNDQLQVESRQLMALNGVLRTDVRFAGLRGASSGQGLFTTVVSGTGQVALVSNGGPLIPLEVSPQYPLVVDPDAFVRWTYARALAHRQPRYGAMADWGVTITADEVAHVRTAADFNSLIATAIDRHPKDCHQG